MTDYETARKIFNEWLCDQDNTSPVAKIEEALAAARQEGAKNSSLKLAEVAKHVLNIARYTGAGPYTEDRFDSVKAAALEAWKLATGKEINS